MKTTPKFLFVCLVMLIVAACATKDYNPDDYKQYTSKQLLKFGEKELSKHNYNEAIKYFEAIDALYPFDPEAGQGQLDTIYAYYKSGDHASAIAAANRYINLYPEGEHTDYAYYMKGIVNFEKDYTVLHKLYPRSHEKLDMTSLRSAFFSFNGLIKKFPKSPYAKDAQKRMVYTRDLLAAHDIYIAKFYFARKAYIAAANRASEIVRSFNGTPQLKEALVIMVKSYRILGLNQQANDAMRVLKLNFPKAKV